MEEDKDNRGVHLGFPNAALDSADVPLDLNKLVVKNRASTFYMRVESDSYEELNIYTGDILAIDRAMEMKPGDIVLCLSQRRPRRERPDDKILKTEVNIGRMGIAQFKTVTPTGWPALEPVTASFVR